MKTSGSAPSHLYSFACAAVTAALLSLAMPGGTGWWPLLFFRTGSIVVGHLPLAAHALCLYGHVLRIAL